MERDSFVFTDSELPTKTAFIFLKVLKKHRHYNSSPTAVVAEQSVIIDYATIIFPSVGQMQRTSICQTSARCGNASSDVDVPDIA